MVVISVLRVSSESGYYATVFICTGTFKNLSWIALLSGLSLYQGGPPAQILKRWFPDGDDSEPHYSQLLNGMKRTGLDKV